MECLNKPGSPVGEASVFSSIVGGFRAGMQACGESFCAADPISEDEHLHHRRVRCVRGHKT